MSELIERATQLNKQAKALNQRSQEARTRREVLMEKAKESATEYEEQFGVSLWVEGDPEATLVNIESARVEEEKSVAEQVELSETVINLINNGDFLGARKALGLVDPSVDLEKANALKGEASVSFGNDPKTGVQQAKVDESLIDADRDGAEHVEEAPEWEDAPEDLEPLPAPAATKTSATTPNAPLSLMDDEDDDLALDAPADSSGILEDNDEGVEELDNPGWFQGDPEGADSAPVEADGGTFIGGDPFLRDDDEADSSSLEEDLLPPRRSAIDLGDVKISKKPVGKKASTAEKITSNEALFDEDSPAKKAETADNFLVDDDEVEDDTPDMLTLSKGSKLSFDD